MITDAIQSILTGLSINAFSPIVNSDDFPSGVFAVHSEQIVEVLRDKVGVYGYDYDVSITVIGDNQEQLDPVTGQIINALEVVIGTITGTVVEEVIFKSSQGVAWDDEKKKYFDHLTFSIQTKNR